MNASIQTSREADGKRIVAAYSSVLPRPGEVETVEKGSRLTIGEVLDIGVTLVVEAIDEIRTRNSQKRVDGSGQV